MWPFKRKNEVLVRVHVASFTNDPEKKYYFINILNFSENQSTIVHEVWHRCGINVINASRPLPVVIQPMEQWETWIDVKELLEKVPPGTWTTYSPYEAFRVKLFFVDKIIFLTSKKRENVPSYGIPPGGNL